MKIHALARSTPYNRMLMVKRIVEEHRSARTVANDFGISVRSVLKWLKRFRDEGEPGLDDRSSRPHKLSRDSGGRLKANDETIKAAIFGLLHSPPAERGINRTSWKLQDIVRCLCADGVHVTKRIVSQVIRAGGYKWRKAKVVLTSNDSEYREKLDRIRSILSNLNANDRFFSVDEFGPFSITLRGGKRLTAPDEYPTIPQYQKSKGRLIVSAALELSQNQITHFYSPAKNTAESLKLIDALLAKYRGRRKLYISWDAAPWHVSKELNERIEIINRISLDTGQTPMVELVPLPVSAQFLNVIESVFSGMARAILHNSDYSSAEDAKAAIDRYFEERNSWFDMHPKRAGNTIWGKERVEACFQEANNCKDPLW